MTFTFTPGYESIDLEFPSQYEPIFPLRVDNKPVFNNAQFNGEIEQVVSWGENQLAREFVVEYFLPIADGNIVDLFLQATIMYNKPFYWKAGNIVPTPIKVRCENWKKELISHNRIKIQATFIEVFDFVGRVYGVTNLGTASFSIAVQNVDLSKGKWTDAATASYSIAVQDADLVFGRIMSADPAAFDISVNPAGPENYYLQADNAASYSVSVLDSDYVIGTAVVSDYFASMSAQVYGWDRDFQVDWWGD